MTCTYLECIKNLFLKVGEKIIYSLSIPINIITNRGSHSFYEKKYISERKLHILVLLCMLGLWKDLNWNHVKVPK